MLKNIIAITLCIPLMACAGANMRPTDVSRGEARSLQRTTEATVIDIMRVTIRGETEIAQGVGAASGGYIANRAAKGENQAVQAAATIAGVLVGSIAGNTVSNVAMDKSGTSIVLRLDSGTVQTITQQNDARVDFDVGDRVWIIYNGNQVRVLPQNI
jgi:outer membrane lipoprotein SlyB